MQIIKKNPIQFIFYYLYYFQIFFGYGFQIFNIFNIPINYIFNYFYFFKKKFKNQQIICFR